MVFDSLPQALRPESDIADAGGSGIGVAMLLRDAARCSVVSTSVMIGGEGQCLRVTVIRVDVCRCLWEIVVKSGPVWPASLLSPL